jgi:hypothetical protein
LGVGLDVTASLDDVAESQRARGFAPLRDLRSPVDKPELGPTRDPHGQLDSVATTRTARSASTSQSQACGSSAWATVRVRTLLLMGDRPIGA